MGDEDEDGDGDEVEGRPTVECLPVVCLAKSLPSPVSRWEFGVQIVTEPVGHS